MIRNSLKQEA